MNLISDNKMVRKNQTIKKLNGKIKTRKYKN